MDRRCGRLVDGGAVNIVLSGIVANFVQPRSGNLQLNFTVCGYSEEIDPYTGEGNGVWVEDCDADKFVHYQRAQNVSRGTGAVVGTDVAGSKWLVFLSSSATNIDGNAFAFDIATSEWSLSGLSAHQLDGSLKTNTAEVTWSAPKAW
jgi:hypothetical protein